MKIKFLFLLLFALISSVNLAAQDLIEAVKSGNINKVKALLPYEDIEERDENNYTAYHWTAIKGYADIAQLLLKNDASPNMLATDVHYVKLEDGWLIWAGDVTGAPDAAVLAQENGKEDLVDFYLKKGNIDYHLRTAIMCDNKEVMERALELGANPNAEVSMTGERIIVTAVKRSLKGGSDDLIEVLLDHDADISAAFANSFIYGKMERDTKVWEKLLDMGAKIDQEYHDQNYDDTLLEFAFEEDLYGKFNFLIRHGADLAVQDNNGRTLLHRKVEALKDVNSLIPPKDICDSDCMHRYLSVRDNNGETACDILKRIHDSAEEDSYAKRYSERTMGLVCNSMR